MKKEKQKKEAGLFLPNREVSWVIALILTLCFLVFCAGYFWGQRKVMSRFLSKIEEDSLADKVTYSLYTMTGKDSTEEQDPEDALGNGQEEVPFEPETADETTKQDDVVDTSVETGPQLVYVAPLVGFGTLHAARSFAQRVKKTGISVIVKERSSKTQRGRRITWYQAVTQEFEKKEELEKVIEIVKKKEHIKEVKIIEKRKAYNA